MYVQCKYKFGLSIIFYSKELLMEEINFNLVNLTKDFKLIKCNISCAQHKTENSMSYGYVR